LGFEHPLEINRNEKRERIVVFQGPHNAPGGWINVGKRGKCKHPELFNTAKTECIRALMLWDAFLQNNGDEEELWTKAMTNQEIGKWFDVSRNHVPEQILDRYLHQKIGSKHRLKLSDMPVEYHAKMGLKQK
jgi:hypothetical protein